jgi:hypothetical protein
MRLKLLCDVCRKPIRGRSGVIWCADHTACEVSRIDRDQKERRGPGVVLLSISDMARDHEELVAAGYKVPWHIQHWECDPVADRACYWFGSERCLTVPELLEWNRHLSEKFWLEFTNWTEFMFRLVAPPK